MKNLVYFLTICFLVLSVSCNNAEKNHVTLSGKISNPNSDSLSVVDRWGGGYYKKIKVDANGAFQDTLRIKTGYYAIGDGTDVIFTYLKKGNDLNFTYDATDYETPVIYKGSLAPYSNYLKESSAIRSDFLLGDKDAMQLEKEIFTTEITKTTDQMFAALEVAKGKNLDSLFVATEDANIKDFLKYYTELYEETQFISTNLAKGTASPLFLDYENYNGGKNSLEDFKGSYVFIDFWATWCGPCIAEVPFLRKLEEKYHDSNITFLSISLDAKKDRDKWNSMVKEDNFPGVQLFAGGDNTFADAYRAQSIPRFVLLDPEGNIIDAIAPSPSSEALAELLEKYL